MLNRFLIISLIITVVVGLTFSQTKYQSREEKLEQLKRRSDIKVTEVEKGIIKIEYPFGKVMYKNIGDYQSQTTNNLQQPTTYSPTFDSTIIDLTTIDTTLYYHKYKFWTEVPLSNSYFNYLRIGDVNNNSKTELYGMRKFFQTPVEPITIYELDNNNNFTFAYQYDSVITSWDIYDYDNDGSSNVHFLGYSHDQRFFKKEADSLFATLLNTSFLPYNRRNQVNDATLGDFDKDGYTDFLFAAGAGRGSVHIFEYNPITNTFDSLYKYQIVEPGQLEASGFSVGDFDQDGKTDIVFGSGQGSVHVIENIGNNQYIHRWAGRVETFAAYIHTWSNDIDKNGKPEFWVLGKAFYSGLAVTRITIFETNGDNSYQVVGRIDLIGVFSFYASNMQAVDIDDDGIDEVAVCIDDNFLILRFNGMRNHQTYEVYYIKQNELTAQGENSVYYGAVVYDLKNNGEMNLLISMDLVQNNKLKNFTQIYKPDSTTYVNTYSTDFNKLFELYNNYPNPFNPVTNIKFYLASPEKITIKIYDILGKEIKTLLEEYLPLGEHYLQWKGNDDNGNPVSSGNYFIQMKAGNYRKTIKITLLK